MSLRYRHGRYRLRVWWHCLWRVSLFDYGHRMCHVEFPRHDHRARFYYCYCGFLERKAFHLWDTGQLELPSGARGRFKDGPVVTNPNWSEES